MELAWIRGFVAETGHGGKLLRLNNALLPLYESINRVASKGQRTELVRIEKGALRLHVGVGATDGMAQRLETENSH